MSSQTEAIARASDSEIQEMLANAVRLYAERASERDGALPAFAPDAATATDVMVTASGLLRSANLAVFELGMWQSWTGR